MSVSPLLRLPNTYRAFYGAFTALRPFQEQVIDPILQRQDVILQAATGSGKTEAVLAPCLERTITSGTAEAILYVVPTRALVHDLYRRLQPIVHDRLGLHLGIRTGDVKRLPTGQADVLLTTPESLDVMLGSPNREVQTCLRRLATVIVDEAHHLIQGYRGCHLAYGLQRLQGCQGQRLQKIALSATLTGPQAIRQALDLQPHAVWVGDAVQRQLQPHLVRLQREPIDVMAFIDDLAQHFGYRKLLLFANSRSHCDRLFAMLRQRGQFQNATYLHYSNLKLRQRQEVERQFQRRAHALCIATSTLELGIDVGDVDGVVLYEPPESVSTFLQRLGRANRQGHTTRFWGVCRGPRAGEQLLQFLALCTLARQGVIETVQPVQLPSVLAQQVLSCLYADKRVSLQSLQARFAARAETLAVLLPEMARRYWLRPDPQRGNNAVWGGGSRYARALRAHQIWSNFPDTDVSYTLQVDDEPVADLPTAVVRQLEVGDRVDLAGRRLHILDIEVEARQVVRATVVEAPVSKELFWLGSGAPISWEVAQAIRPWRQADEGLDSVVARGLFSRPRALLQQQQQQAQRQVVLHNGIELSRTSQGLYRYVTYLGSVGNLILQRTLKVYYEASLADFSSQADAIAVDCTHRVDLQPLPLPIGREAFRRWADQHLQAVQAMFPFNVFARALPRRLLIEEATAFLWDARLSETFQRYREASSDIAHGDPQHLEWGDVLGPQEPQPASLPLYQGPEPSILAQEKARLGLAQHTAAQLPGVPERHIAPRALTGTLVGTYMQHQQCDRLLSFALLPEAQQPPRRTLVDRPLGAARAAQGQDFEARVLAWLAQQGTSVRRIDDRDRDASGMPLALAARQARSLAWLQACVQAGATSDVAPAGHDGHGVLVGYLAQAVLMLPAPADDGRLAPVDSIGIPDLIEVRLASDAVCLTVADVKDSAAPSYSQKWQVAFYAALLQAWLRGYTFALPVRAAEYGVIFTPAQETTAVATRHIFDLAPYLTVLPMLYQHLASVLQTPLLEAPWQLRTHCTTCAYLDTCYRQAFSSHDLMLMPHLTPGQQGKLQALGCHSLAQVADTLPADNAEAQTSGLSPQQVVSLRARASALTDNQVQMLSTSTDLYPNNIATVVCMHLWPDPVSGRPRVWGLHRLDAVGALVEAPVCWIASTEADMSVCLEAFVEQLHSWWRQAIQASAGPHLVTFGNRSVRLLREAMAASAQPQRLDFLWSAQPPRHTDLRQVLARHVALPVPLHASLASAARAWGLRPELPPPPYLLVDEADTVHELLLQPCLGLAQTAWLQAQMSTHLELLQRLWQVCTPHLRSDWRQNAWEEAATAPEAALEQACVNFLERQQQWREHDILAVQQLPWRERVARYRSLGPLAFQHTALNDEGRFLYHFCLPPETLPGRFRAGDFLRLNPTEQTDPQAGVPVILMQYDPHAQQLAVVARRGQALLQPQRRYTLDEDMEDWTTPRVLHAVRQALAPGNYPHLTALLSGALPLTPAPARLAWAQRWLRRVTLNARQQAALLLPFRSCLGLIEGPPGTGKTHLLAAMLIALIQEAQEAGRPLRVAVSALTHQAIDNVLLKVEQVRHGLPGTGFQGYCLKWGQRPSCASTPDDARGLTYVDDAEDVLQIPHLILGATGYGLYNLFNSQTGAFPAFFDWVIVDEASQMVLPQAVLSLVYGKGQYVFCGDVQQLPPVIPGAQEVDATTVPAQSILAHLLAIHDPAVRVRLNETYRMNQELCLLPSRLWYDGDLHPAPGNASARLQLSDRKPADLVDAILDPARPVTLVLAAHTTSHQQSVLEAEIMARLACRLLTDHGLDPERLAMVSPHRAQNATIAQHLAGLLAAHQASPMLPVIDTVERLQGAERDVLLFSVTTSDPDQIDNPFLNHPNRFNVAITRARHKLVVVGSQAFFTGVPHTDTALERHHAFAVFYHHCRTHGALFTWPSP